eukprot:TRINITY_DN45612_c0_g1_i2.p1 TRINITY_DN45612_c0_g1~~TRINITY_DN45612_c0_g1_i2.p1  ORF type:complete len:134 (+),score=17.64 TRINITY_DN45612_c0_g1_i2:42-404(+)
MGPIKTLAKFYELYAIDIFKKTGFSRSCIAVTCMDILFGIAENKCRTEDDKVSLLAPGLPQIGEEVEHERDSSLLIVHSRRFVPNKNGTEGVTITYLDPQKIGRAVQQECRDRSRMPSSA